MEQAEDRLGIEGAQIGNRQGNCCSRSLATTSSEAGDDLPAARPSGLSDAQMDARLRGEEVEFGLQPRRDLACDGYRQSCNSFEDRLGATEQATVGTELRQWQQRDGSRRAVVG